MTKRTCTLPGCNRPHQARGLCGGHYAEKYYPNRHAPKTLTCQQCGTKYKTSRHNGMYCSYDCRTQALREQQRGVFRPPIKFKVWILHCEHCGKQFNHPTNKDQKYCSSTCRVASIKARTAVTVVCRICGTKFEAYTKTASLCSPACKWRSTANNRGIVSHEETLAEERECATCGDKFHSRYATTKYCSSKCQPHLSGWITEARRLTIYERDHWLCYLCGTPVVREGDVNADNYATIDHVIPRSKGGDDSDDNLRTCCRQCNTRKSDQEAVETQLTLFA